MITIKSTWLYPSGRTHLFMLACFAILSAAAIWGLTIRSASGWQNIAKAGAALLPVSLLPAILYHDRKKFEERNAALTLPWVFLLVTIIPPLAVLSVRFQFPLRDALFSKLDSALGFHIASLSAWISTHPGLHAFSDRAYDSLYVLLPAAMLLPGLFGKRVAAEQFIVANAAALLISFPIFTVFPAIGPWAGSSFTGNAAQQACEAAIVALHNGSTTAAVAGVVCFPSFHVIWAVHSGWSLWSVRLLRVPAAVLAALVTISTLTTGWHYFVDVAAGLLVSAVTLYLAKRIVVPST